LAGLNPAAVICEVMNPDGTMARSQDLHNFAKTHGLKIGTIVDLIQYRLSHETLVEEVGHFKLEDQSGFSLKVFRSRIDGLEHLVLQKGLVEKDQATVVRVQVQAPFVDTLSILQQKTSSLQKSLDYLKNEKSGIIVLLNTATQNNLLNQVQSAFSNHAPTKFDSRDYGIGAQILRHLGVRKLRLLSSQPENADKYIGLKGFNLEISEIVSFNKR
ncbi:MAG: 3,4-dihydroxy-2-butanone-4-phosphate synthase, partial [Pseudobdellovibrionaceae bacterium]